MTETLYVSTEGGPILLGDLELVARGWRGTFGDGSDFEELVTLLNDGRPTARVTIDAESVIAWDVPTGVVSVDRRHDGSLEMRSARRAGRFVRRFEAGELKLPSGWLVVMWAAEDGRDLRKVVPRDGLSLGLSVGHSALVLKAETPVCLVAHGESDTEPESLLHVEYR